MNPNQDWKTNSTGWTKRILWWSLKITLWVALVVLAIGVLTQLLWNTLMPDIFNLPSISLWQAIGLALLGRLLAGGWFRLGGWGWRGHRGHWRKHWHQRWQNLTPEEREQYRKAYYQRCQPHTQGTTDAPVAQPTAL